MADDGDGTRLVSTADVRRSLAGAFERLGLTPEDGADLAGLLVDSELRGHPDHGVAALGILAGFYREGALNPRPQVRVLRETEGALLLHGDRGCGPGAPMRAMRWCIDRARERRGMAVAAVRDWQLLVAGPYARLAAQAGLIGFTCTNFVPLVAPPGGTRPIFGTNPLAYGLPARRHPPVVLDMATTVSAMQKIRLAAEGGVPVPEGVIFDRAGRPTTNPEALFDGGSMAPLGAPLAPYKGFGLALVVDALSGVLAGGRFGQDVAGARRAACCGRSTLRRSFRATSSSRAWTPRSTRSSRPSRCQAGLSSRCPASAVRGVWRITSRMGRWRWPRRAGRSS